MSGLYELPLPPCPRHFSVYELKRCPRCWQRFMEHNERIAALPPLREQK